tara:strand:- start:409 stop:669 length:261 start_codon:yes stop_codon:yes gene_type:complete
MSEKKKHKPRYIECIYQAPITFDLEELEVNFDKVEDYYIKYGTLHITYKDGSTAEHDGDIGDPDYKWAVEENILTDGWDFVEDEDE